MTQLTQSPAWQELSQLSGKLPDRLKLFAHNLQRLVQLAR